MNLIKTCSFLRQLITLLYLNNSLHIYLTLSLLLWMYSGAKSDFCDINVMNSITCSFLPQLITLLYLNNSLQYLFDTFFTLMNVYWGKIRFWWHLSFALSPTCAAPTRDGSLVDFSLLKVRHSEPTSTTLDELKEQTQLNCWPTGGDLVIVSLISTPP